MYSSYLIYSDTPVNEPKPLASIPTSTVRSTVSSVPPGKGYCPYWTFSLARWREVGRISITVEVEAHLRLQPITTDRTRAEVIRSLLLPDHIARRTGCRSLDPRLSLGAVPLRLRPAEVDILDLGRCAREQPGAARDQALRRTFAVHAGHVLHPLGTGVDSPVGKTSDDQVELGVWDGDVVPVVRQCRAVDEIVCVTFWSMVEHAVEAVLFEVPSPDDGAALAVAAVGLDDGIDPDQQGGCHAGQARLCWQDLCASRPGEADHGGAAIDEPAVVDSETRFKEERSCENECCESVLCPGHDESSTITEAAMLNLEEMSSFPQGHSYIWSSLTHGNTLHAGICQVRCRLVHDEVSHTAQHIARSHGWAIFSVAQHTTLQCSFLIHPTLHLAQVDEAERCHRRPSWSIEGCRDRAVVVITIRRFCRVSLVYGVAIPHEIRRQEHVRDGHVISSHGGSCYHWRNHLVAGRGNDGADVLKHGWPAPSIVHRTPWTLGLHSPRT